MKHPLATLHTLAFSQGYLDILRGLWILSSSLETFLGLLLSFFMLAPEFEPFPEDTAVLDGVLSFQDEMQGPFPAGKKRAEVLLEGQHPR